MERRKRLALVAAIMGSFVVALDATAANVSVGVAEFGVVSLLCAIAPSIGVLISCRALQRVFGALLTPSALAVIVAAFPGGARLCDRFLSLRLVRDRGQRLVRSQPSRPVTTRRPLQA